MPKTLRNSWGWEMTEENMVVIDGVKIPQYMLESNKDFFKIIQEDEWFSLVNETDEGEYEYWYLSKNEEDLVGYRNQMNQNLTNFRAKFRMGNMVTEKIGKESESTLWNYGFFGYTE